MATKKEKAEKPKIPLYTFPGTKEEQLQKLYDQWFKCQRCGLKDFRCNDNGVAIDDVVFCSGNPNSGIMIIGEAPGEEEARDLVPFVGRSGKLLNQILAAVSSDKDIKALYEWYGKIAHTKENEKKFHEEVFAWREANFFLTNVVACRPPENRQPIPPEIQPCSERLLNLIYIVDPMIIISSGRTAAEALIGKKVEVTSKRGELFEMKISGKVGELSYPVVVTLHPSFLLRKADWNVKGGDYTKTVGDFMRAMKVHDFLMEKNHGIAMPDRGIG